MRLKNGLRKKTIKAILLIMTDSREIQDKEELDCPVCMKLMRTHTYSDLTDCMKKLFGMIDVSHSNKKQDLSQGVKLALS